MIKKEKIKFVNPNEFSKNITNKKIKQSVDGNTSTVYINPLNALRFVLNELKKEAYELGADGVIGVDLDYSEISGKGKGMLFLVASGTAVKFKE